MKFSVDKKEKYVLLSIHETKLNSEISPDLKAEFVVLNSENVKNILVDLSEVQYCDSSGLSALLVGNRFCRNNNGSFILTNIQEHVKKLISISQLDSILTSTPTVNEGVDLLFMEEIEKQIQKD
jgi:anti-sigma B factor antagonist